MSKDNRFISATLIERELGKADSVELLECEGIGEREVLVYAAIKWNRLKRKDGRTRKYKRRIARDGDGGIKM